MSSTTTSSSTTSSSTTSSEELPPITSSSTSQLTDSFTTSESDTSTNSSTTSELTTPTSSTTSSTTSSSSASSTEGPASPTSDSSSKQSQQQPTSTPTTSYNGGDNDPTSQPHSTTVISTTVVITPSGGGGVITTVVATTLPIASQPTSADITDSNSDNTGVIVGAVIGALGGVLILLIIGYFIWRRRRRAKALEHFDGNFDPAPRHSRSSRHDVGGTLPAIELDDEEDGTSRMTGRQSGSEFNPWSPASPEMRQTSPPPLNPVYLSQGSPRPPSQYSEGANTGQQYYPYPSAPSSINSPMPAHYYYNNPMPVPDRNGTASPPHSASSSASQSRRSAKEQEAYGNRYVVNSSEEGGHPRIPSRMSGGYTENAYQAYLANGPGPSNVSYTNHRSIGSAGGRRASYYPDAAAPPTVVEAAQEVPPTYESIPGNSAIPPPSEKA